MTLKDADFDSLVTEVAKRKKEKHRGRVQFINGEKFEIKVRNKLSKRSDVLYCQRAAGSYGLWDLICIMKNGTIRFISCKLSGYHCPEERKEISKFLEKSKKSQGKISLEVFYYKTTRKMGQKFIKSQFDIAWMESDHREK